MCRGKVSFRQTSSIYALELDDPPLTLFELKEALANKNGIFFIDNNASSGALIMGASPDDIIETYVALFWPVASQFNITIWIERVSIGSNIAGHPARHIPLPIPHRRERKYWPWDEWGKLDGEIPPK